MYVNGFNREKVMQVIRKENKGEVSKAGSGSNNTCMYRNYDGNKCLVGCFIPDDKYDDSMEDKDASCVIGRYDLESYMPMVSMQMTDLQRFHDETLDYMQLNSDVRTNEEFYNAIEEKLVQMENMG